MLKHAEHVRRRTGSSVTAQVTAIVVGCVMVAGAVSAAEINILNNSAPETNITTELAP